MMMTSFFIDNEGHDADDDESFDLNEGIENVMDGWDDPLVTDETFLDEAHDGQTKISFDDYIPDDAWLKEVNSLASDI